MFKLCGFAASNYYNKVKLALLEKGVPFEEELVWLGETDQAASPLGKVRERSAATARRQSPSGR